MKLWLIGLSTAALAGAMPSPLQARQNLKYIHERSKIYYPLPYPDD